MARGETVTVTVRELAGRGAKGASVYNERDVDVDGVVVWPTGSTEDVQGRDTVTAGLTVLIPPSAPVTVDAIAKITVRGNPYEVDGTPDDWQSPFTRRKPGLAVRLKRVTG